MTSSETRQRVAARRVARSRYLVIALLILLLLLGLAFQIARMR